MNVIVILGIIIFLYLFLIAPRMTNKPDRSFLMGRHYAHRGLFNNKSEAPENSLAAFRKAVEDNYGIEWDVQLSKDNIPVIFHDKTLKRMCGIEGNVWDYTLEELKSFRLKDSKETIPTLEEALQVVDGRVPLIIEYKLDRVQTEVCRISNEILKKYKGAYCIECFHPLALIWYKKNRPDIVRGQLCQEFWKTEEYKGFIYIIMSLLLPNVATRPDFVAYKHEDASNISRRLCSVLGALPVAYTIKSVEEYKKVEKDFELFIFDSCRL